MSSKARCLNYMVTWEYTHVENLKDQKLLSISASPLPAPQTPWRRRWCCSAAAEGSCWSFHWRSSTTIGVYWMLPPGVKQAGAANCYLRTQAVWLQCGANINVILVERLWRAEENRSLLWPQKHFSDCWRNALNGDAFMPPASDRSHGVSDYQHYDRLSSEHCSTSKRVIWNESWPNDTLLLVTTASFLQL